MRTRKTPPAPARQLATYRVTLTITVDRHHFTTPEEWDWETIIDPDLSAGLWFEAEAEPVPLDPDHAQGIANFDAEN